MIALRWRKASPALKLRWVGPVVTPVATPAPDAAPIAVRIGPPGPRGVPGPEGPPGGGAAADPGDLDVYFANGLV